MVSELGSLPKRVQWFSGVELTIQLGALFASGACRSPRFILHLLLLLLRCVWSGLYEALTRRPMVRSNLSQKPYTGQSVGLFGTKVYR